MQIDTSHTSPNQSPGRQGMRIDRIVWHHTGGGSVASAISWVTRPESQVSYHYLVDEAGRIFRVVPEQNTSWHAGDWTMNLRSIGICHPVNGGGAATRESSVALARDICRRFGIPADGGHIIPHRAVVPTACPGALPMAEWIALVAGPPTPPPVPGLEDGEMSEVIVIGAEDTRNGPFVIPDCFEGQGWTTWFAAVAQRDSVFDIAAWNGVGTFLGWQEGVSLRAAQWGSSGPQLWSGNGQSQWGINGPYTLGIMIRSGGPIHFTRRMQRV